MDEMGTLLIPRSVYENRLPAFLELLGKYPDDQQIDVDWAENKTLIPGAMVALLCAIAGWNQQGKRVQFLNLKQCPALTYIQRMNFLQQCGIDIPEEFTRRDGTGRFVEITRIGRGGEINPGPLATKVAECIVPDLANAVDPEKTGPLDCIEFSISELATNVVQHSRGHGYVFAQYSPHTDMVRIGIADCGIGVQASFEVSGSPHWQPGMSDLEAIEKAITPRVSSKNHIVGAWNSGPVNAGVGLTLLKELTIQVQGSFLICSGHGIYSLSGTSKMQGEFNGTLCAMALKRSATRDFVGLLQEAKQRAGLLGSRSAYAEVFE